MKNSRNAELIKNTAIIAFGRICTQLISFLLLPIYTNHLSTSEYGTIDFIITCITVIAPVLSLQMERAIFRFLIDARKDKIYRDKILSSAITAIIPSLLFVIVILPIIGIAFNLHYWQYIELLLISSILTNVFLQIPRGLGKNMHYSIASIIIGALNASISITTVVFLKMGIVGVLIGHIVANIAGVSYLLISLKLCTHIKISKRDKSTLKEMLKFSIPMIPSDIGYWIISVSDRILIFLFLGNSFNGIYATSTKFPTIMVTLYNMFNLSWMETVSAHINDKDADKYLSDTFNSITLLFASLCNLAISIMPFIFSIIIGNDFSDSYKYIAVLIFAAFFNIVVGMLGSIYIGYKKTKEIAKTNIVAAIINILINLALINYIGIWAAVLSTLIAFFTVSSYRLLQIQKTVRIKPKWRNFIVALILFSISISLYSIGGTVSNIINIILMPVATFFLNRKIISKILSHSKELIKRKV